MWEDDLEDDLEPGSMEEAYRPDPNVYCQRCNGTGWQEFIENGAPHGCGFWPMPMWEPCTCWTSVSDPHCPQCGATPTFTEDEQDAYCSCGWSSSPEEDYPAPPDERP